MSGYYIDRNEWTAIVFPFVNAKQVDNHTLQYSKFIFKKCGDKCPYFLYNYTNGMLHA